MKCFGPQHIVSGFYIVTKCKHIHIQNQNKGFTKINPTFIMQNTLLYFLFHSVPFITCWLWLTKWMLKPTNKVVFNIARYTHSKSFQKYWCLGSIPKDPDINGLACGPGICVIKIPSGDWMYGQGWKFPPPAKPRLSSPLLCTHGLHSVPNQGELWSSDDQTLLIGWNNHVAYRAKGTCFLIWSVWNNTNYQNFRHLKATKQNYSLFPSKLKN